MVSEYRYISSRSDYYRECSEMIKISRENYIHFYEERGKIV